MSMKSLLWKDYRQNRRVYIAVGVFLLMPYVIAIVVAAVEAWRAETLPPHVGAHWADFGLAAGAWSLGLLVLACAFIGGNIIACERADRSAEFAAYLPIARGPAVTSKIVVSIGVCLSAVLINLVIMLVIAMVGKLLADVVLRSGVEFQSDVLDAIGIGVATATMVFGVSWLFSSLLSSPGLAAASGIAAIPIVLGTLMFITNFGGDENLGVVLERMYFPLCVLLGVGCFVGGVVCYLRRAEP